MTKLMINDKTDAKLPIVFLIITSFQIECCHQFANYVIYIYFLQCTYIGIFMAAQLTLPKDCSGNAFCEITKMIIGPTAKFYITGQFQSKKIRVAVGFAHVRIWDGLYFDKLELYVEVSQF